MQNLVCAYFTQLSHNPLTNIGALTLLKTVKNNTRSAVEKIDISVSAAKQLSPQHMNFCLIMNLVVHAHLCTSLPAVLLVCVHV